jgi:type II secretory pathway predicted ATPase ExeA
MTANRLLSFYGLKWNPFAPDVPTEALLSTPPIDHFGWRVEHLVSEGGFALISGDSGTGKSAVLRLVAHRLSQLSDVVVGVVSRPQSGVSDSYRELGELFGLNLSPRNRWGGFKALRERWKAHVDSTLLRPVLLIDEAQQMAPAVLSELRMLASGHFDTVSYLTVVLCGDGRLTDLFRHEDLVPLASRIRTRLFMEYASREQLMTLLKHAVTQAGNANLMTEPLMQTLCEHAAGNCRLLMAMAGELLMEGLAREQAKLDEKLYLQVFQVPSGADQRKGKHRNSPQPAIGVTQ